MLTHRFQFADQHVDLEIAGPFDSQLWSFRDLSLGPPYAAAVVGSGVDIRSAIENALRNLLRTPLEQYKPALTVEVMNWLATRPDADVRQGDSIVRVYCILKWLR